MKKQDEGQDELSSSGDDFRLIEEDWASSSQLAPADVDALFSILECGICVDFLSQATETPCCHKLFCRPCLAGWAVARPSCPACRAKLPDVASLPSNVVIQRFVDGMAVECPHGCAARPARSDLETHTRVCELRPEEAARRRGRAPGRTGRSHDGSLRTTGRQDAAPRQSLWRWRAICWR